jgi:hypothetical protein
MNGPVLWGQVIDGKLCLAQDMIDVLLKAVR